MKVVSVCYVIESRDYGVEPVIYLNRPNTHFDNEKLHECGNPFEARAFIREHKTESVEVIVTSDTFSRVDRLVTMIK